MTIEKLERVMWRVRKDNPMQTIITNNNLEKAIMKEIGIDRRTYNANRRALIKLGWIKSYNKKTVVITDKDLTDG